MKTTCARNESKKSRRRATRPRRATNTPKSRSFPTTAIPTKCCRSRSITWASCTKPRFRRNRSVEKSTGRNPRDPRGEKLRRLAPIEKLRPPPRIKLGQRSKGVDFGQGPLEALFLPQFHEFEELFGRIALDQKSHERCALAVEGVALRPCRIFGQGDEVSCRVPGRFAQRPLHRRTPDRLPRRWFAEDRH